MTDDESLIDSRAETMVVRDRDAGLRSVQQISYISSHRIVLQTKDIQIFAVNKQPLMLLYFHRVTLTLVTAWRVAIEAYSPLSLHGGGVFTPWNYS